MSTAIIEFTRSRMVRLLAIALTALVLAFAARPLLAQTAPAAAPVAASPAAPAAVAAPADTTAAPPTPAASPTAAAWVPMTPTPGIGMPVDGGLDVQKQFSPSGRFAFKLHYGLLWVMGIICVFVLALLVYVMVRFRAKANPVPSRTTHNAVLEVAWTLLPAFVLLGIAIPSISLLAQQYRSPPKDAVTVKITGNQWYWSYSFPDNGDFSFDSYMLNEPGQAKVNPQQRDVGTRPYDGPAQLEVDNRLVLPVGVPLRMQVTAGDVIHSFAVPALWFKIDAVPGRLNERVLTIEKPGVYYGQCSELCGVKHAYMPIAIEAVPLARWRQWVLAQGGTLGDPAPAAPAAAPLQQPASALPQSEVPAAATSAAPQASPSAVAPVSPTPAP